MDKKYLYSKLLENVKKHFKEDLNGLQDLQYIIKDEESTKLFNDSDTIKVIASGEKMDFVINPKAI